MFFYLSQFLSFLAMPLTIIIFLILAGAVANKKKILWIGIVLLLFFSNQFISNKAMQLWEPDYKVFSTLPEYEIGIVLTGVTNLSKITFDRTFFNKGADRATHAVQLYKMGKIKKILITGGQGLNPNHPYSEAELLRDFMVMAGVDENDILVESQAKNTYQNAVLAKETMLKNGIPLQEKSLLITSAFHMKRSKGCFDKVGLSTDTFPVDYYAHESKYDIPSLLYPNPNAINHWHTLAKEWIGIVTYSILGYL